MLTGLQLRLLGAAATLAAGFAAAEIYEHQVPWGLGPKLERLRLSLPARDAERYTTGARDQRARDQAIVDNSWRPALRLCESNRLVASQTAATSIDAERDAASRSSSAAYRLGRASCTGVKTSGTSSTSTPGSPAPVVMPGDEDIRNLVASGLGRAP